MVKIVMYTKEHCPYCDHAKALLQSKQLTFTEIAVDTDSEQLAAMLRLSGRRTVPQIFINDQAIGGYDDLARLAQSGELDAMLV